VSPIFAIKVGNFDGEILYFENVDRWCKTMFHHKKY